MRDQHAVSIIVPTYNEADNVRLLVDRIDASMHAAKLQYEIIFIDDNSTDNTAAIVRKLARQFPVRLYMKRGQKGKAYSLLQGFKKVDYDIICMIDADLQYPPEAIAKMFRLQQASGADMVITNRVAAKTSFSRRLASGIFNLIFARLLFGFRYDTQSGLKIFTREVIESVEIQPTPWSFDLEFIVRSLEKGYRILSYDIVFSQRHAGEAKVNLITNSFELGWAALKVRYNSSAKAVRRSVQRSAKLAQGLGILLFIAGLTFMVSPVKAASVEVGPVKVTIPASLQDQPVKAVKQTQAQAEVKQAETPAQTAEPQAATAPVVEQQTAVQPTAPSIQTTQTLSMQSPATSSLNTTPAEDSSQAIPVYTAAASAPAAQSLYAPAQVASTKGLSAFAAVALSIGAALLIAIATAVIVRLKKQHKVKTNE